MSRQGNLILFSHRQSARLFERACDVLVGGVNSPVRAFAAVGGEPVFVDHMEGAHVHDVVEAVRRTAQGGLNFGASCEAETALASSSSRPCRRSSWCDWSTAAPTPR